MLFIIALILGGSSAFSASGECDPTALLGREKYLSEIPAQPITSSGQWIAGIRHFLFRPAAPTYNKLSEQQDLEIRYDEKTGRHLFYRAQSGPLDSLWYVIMTPSGQMKLFYGFGQFKPWIRKVNEPVSSLVSINFDRGLIRHIFPFDPRELTSGNVNHLATAENEKQFLQELLARGLTANDFAPMKTFIFRSADGENIVDYRSEELEGYTTEEVQRGLAARWKLPINKVIMDIRDGEVAKLYPHSTPETLGQVQEGQPIDEKYIEALLSRTGS